MHTYTMLALSRIGLNIEKNVLSRNKYFGSVCELDIIFNFEKAYFMWDEFVLGGEVQETSKKNVFLQNKVIDY